MGTSSVAVASRPETRRRCIDVTDMRARRLPAYVRRQRDAGEFHLERRAGRTYLVSNE
jgi:hypothetical protein